MDVFQKRLITEQFPCTLTTDGWKDLSSHPPVNFILVQRQDIIFHDAVNATGGERTANGQYDIVKAKIEEIGADRICHVVTDNPNVNKSLRRLMNTS